VARLDVEWLAFSAGLKPAVRRTVAPARADEIVARFTREGAVVLRASRTAVLGGREQVVLYAARSHDLAAALRDAESSVLPGHAPEGDALAAHRAVGALLGFPVCCVEAFCARLARGVDRLVDGGPGGYAEDYVASRAAWVSAPDARVNPLLMRAGAQLVSFYPCRFDCPRAVALAEALRAVVAVRDAGAARGLMATLSRAVVVASDGARAQVVVEAGTVVRAAAPTREGVADARDVALAGALVGARVGEDGAVRGVDPVRGEPGWCVRFDARA
jgi:hypothetical protein